MSDNTPQPDCTPESPLAARRFTWMGVVWLPAAVFLGVVAAWVAVEAQFYYAPLVLFPILVGVGLGAMLVGLARVTQFGNRPTIFAGSVLAVAVAVVGQHYAIYREALRGEARRAEALQKAGVSFPDLREPPADLLDFLRRQAADGRPLWRGRYVARDWAAWLSWAVDGLLVLAATLVMVIPAVRQPYCNRCRSWYGTVRSGRIGAAAARQLADLAGASLDPRIKAARYRLSTCRGGCSPTRLQLLWEEPAGRTVRTTAWLDPAQRTRAWQALDEAAAEDQGGR